MVILKDNFLLPLVKHRNVLKTFLYGDSHINNFDFKVP